MPRPYYDARHQRIRAMMLDPPVPCAHCQRARATQLDHDPPLAMHVHREGSSCCRLIPSCAPCNQSLGGTVATGEWRPNMAPYGSELDAEPERDGLEPDDPRWRVPWLEPLLDIPANATWPRLMTVPHPDAVDSLGPDFIVWAEERTRKPLRWWQRLVATRLLEIDADDRLVWEVLVLSMARQLGKSWLLRELCFWRIHEGIRFGEPQDVLHTGKDLNICKEVQRPARAWAKSWPTLYRVRETNGQEEIEVIEDGARWMLRAREAVYGYAASMGAVDEAWKVRAASIEEGLVPTMVEREQPQLLLISTAHRMATALMLGRRQAAIDQLERGRGELLIEWSARAGADLEDERAWRDASPYWNDRRRGMVARRLELARAGDIDDPEEPDPIASFCAQWLNQWPIRITEARGKTEPLLPKGAWAELEEELEAEHQASIWLAVEDDFGLGAAVAAVARRDDGRLEVDGWLCPDWDSAMADVRALAAFRPVRQLLVGATLVDRVPDGLVVTPEAAAGTETRHGLALIRDLVLAGQVVHDVGRHELDKALEVAEVREAVSGLQLAARGPAHLVKALVWALGAAHRPAVVPAIY